VLITNGMCRHVTKEAVVAISQDGNVSPRHLGSSQLQFGFVRIRRFCHLWFSAVDSRNKRLSEQNSRSNCSCSFS
jgi:hypothetical protein